jgi:hypothetical protein
MANHQILTLEAHADLRVRTDHGAALGDEIMSCLVVPAEFRQVQSEYLILFRRNVERDSFMALAMFGFENGENLYLENGVWDAEARPLAMDIRPFLIGSADPDGQKQVHIDLDSPRLGSADGVRVFDEHGRPSPYFEDIIDKLGALDAGYQESSDFFAALERHDLLEPMSLEITLVDGSTNRLVGFHVIDEARLQALDADALGELHEAGLLMPIFMAIASLGNMSKLVGRKNRRVRHG